MTPETIAQVDAWLAGRAPTALSRRWGFFVSSWWYEREKWPNDVHATEAAMCGVLLALVRDAWGDPNLYLAIIDCSPAHSSRVFLRWTVFKPASHGSIVGLYESEVEALAAALMAATRSEVNRE